MNGECRYRGLSQRRGSPQCRVAIRGDIEPRRGRCSQCAASRLSTSRSLRLPRRSARLGGRLAQICGLFYPGSSAPRGQKAFPKNGDCRRFARQILGLSFCGADPALGGECSANGFSAVRTEKREGRIKEACCSVYCPHSAHWFNIGEADPLAGGSPPGVPLES